MGVQTFLLELGVNECERRLATASLGRLGVIVDGRPEIFPVNHAFDPVTRRVLFPTRAGTKLHAALHWPWVAFEVDGEEPDGSAGWSVLVVGKAEEVTDNAEIARASQLRKVLWGTGTGVHWIGVDSSQTTGRQISAPSTSF